MRLLMNEPGISEETSAYIKQVLDSRWIGSRGPFSAKLEEYLACITGCQGCVVVTSGTAALVGALKALGVTKKTHSVVCPAFTCAACADAVVHAGGAPLIVDCEKETFGLSYDSVCDALATCPNIVGVIVAPCYGVPCRDTVAIRKLCDEHRIWLLEDNCESYGATLSGTPLGSIGEMSVISLRSEKLIAVGEGGAILSKSKDLIEKSRWWCSRSPSDPDRLWLRYKHDTVGFNFLMPDLLAAVGLASAQKFPDTVFKKRQLNQWYRASFSEHPQVRFQEFTAEAYPVFWITAIIVPIDAERLGTDIIAHHPEIELRPGFYPMNQQDPFKENACKCPNAEDLYKQVICLPSSNRMTRADVEYVARSVIESLMRITVYFQENLTI